MISKQLDRPEIEKHCHKTEQVPVKISREETELLPFQQLMKTCCCELGSGGATAPLRSQETPRGTRGGVWGVRDSSLQGKGLRELGSIG